MKKKRAIAKMLVIFLYQCFHSFRMIAIDPHVLSEWLMKPMVESVSSFFFQEAEAFYLCYHRLFSFITVLLRISHHPLCQYPQETS